MSSDIKSRVYTALGSACAKCGYNYSTAPLSVVSEGGERRPQAVQYMAWLTSALLGAMDGTGGFALWCSNCLAVKVEEAEVARAAEEALASNPALRRVSVAVWRVAYPKETALAMKSVWMERKAEAGTEGFVVVETGEVFGYDPKVQWEKAVPVAKDWAAFAAERGLEEGEPAEGTTVVKVRGK